MGGWLTETLKSGFKKLLDEAEHDLLDHTGVPGVGSGTDPDAIHDNVAGEIQAVTEKTSLVDNDEFIIEDSAASGAKKSLKASAIDSYINAADAYQSQRIIYTSSGTFSKGSYSWATEAVITCQGGGGGGGGAEATASGEASGGGGGQGGQFVIGQVSLSSMGASETVTVGSGGTGTSTTPWDGNSGGDSSFGTHVVAKGGAGGSGGVAAAVPARYGTGGNGSQSATGDLAIDGGGGATTVIDSASRAKTCAGGASHMGNPGHEVTTTLGSNGSTGGDYGAGGTGAANAQSQSARAGATGGDGIVIVDLFSS